MDRKIEKKKWPTKRLIPGGIICLLVFTVGYLLYFNIGGGTPDEKNGHAAISPVKKKDGIDNLDHDYVRKKQLITIGESFNVTSGVLGEEREILIYLPSGYRESSAKYHVLYLLDAQWDFYLTLGIVHYLSTSRYIPKLIVVAIPNNNLYDRNRNLTPTGSPKDPSSGGAGLFLNFIKEDLIPYIESNYRTYSYRILAGHSLGGLFTVYSLLSEHDLFNAYIAISPSLWWDNGLLIKKGEEFFSKQVGLNKTLVMTLCQEGELMLSSVKKFEKVLREKIPEGFRLVVRYMDDEDKDDHITTAIRSTALSLRAIYKNWQLPDNIIAKGLKSMKTHIIKLSDELGYNIVIPEYLANKMGYGYVYEKKYKMAISMFKYNVEIYPDSANVYDSLAEAYMLDKQYELAKQNYTKVLELDPGNLPAKKILVELEDKLKRR